MTTSINLKTSPPVIIVLPSVWSHSAQSGIDKRYFFLETSCLYKINTKSTIKNHQLKNKAVKTKSSSFTRFVILVEVVVSSFKNWDFKRKSDNVSVSDVSEESNSSKKTTWRFVLSSWWISSNSLEGCYECVVILSQAR